MRKVQLFRNVESPQWVAYDAAYKSWLNALLPQRTRPTVPKCDRYTVEPCGEGLFHGFFQKTELTSDGAPEHYPIALVEKPDGTMEEFLPERVRFCLVEKTTMKAADYIAMLERQIAYLRKHDEKGQP